MARTASAIAKAAGVAFETILDSAQGVFGTKKKERKDNGGLHVVKAHCKPNGPQTLVLLKDLSCLICNLVRDRRVSREAGYDSGS